jgi:MFS superfamily sulfate permease-like transporter
VIDVNTCVIDVKTYVIDVNTYVIDVKTDVVGVKAYVIYVDTSQTSEAGSQNPSWPNRLIIIIIIIMIIIIICVRARRRGIISVFGQLALRAPSAGVRHISTSTTYVFTNPRH